MEADLEGSLHLVLAPNLVCVPPRSRSGGTAPSTRPAPPQVAGSPLLHGQTGALGEVSNLVRDAAEQEPG
jgi:hypothetical protein